MYIKNIYMKKFRNKEWILSGTALMICLGFTEW